MPDLMDFCLIRFHRMSYEPFPLDAPHLQFNPFENWQQGQTEHSDRKREG